jgi:hypothetical protein
MDYWNNFFYWCFISNIIKLGKPTFPTGRMMQPLVVVLEVKLLLIHATFAELIIFIDTITVR